ncbi:MAG: 6-phosphogluconolactonase [Opitutaceae bacterium]|nr:6-phosphogluconolactonase [Opitutaceae bacterium]
MTAAPSGFQHAPEHPSPPTLPPSWEWHLYPDEEAMSQAVAARLAEGVRTKPDALIGLATGISPKRSYELLVASARREPTRYARARWLKLDEWGGLAMDDPATCEHFLRHLLLTPLAVPAERYFGWESRPVDAAAECRRVAAWLAANGPIDIQVLGLGKNGHLGFNEPAPQLHPGPHVATLSSESLSHSMLRQSRGRVAYGLTLGMDDILGARHIFLLVSGARKARQLRRLVTGEISPEFPASLLRRHRGVVVFCDAAAAALLPLPESPVSPSASPQPR